MVSALMVGSSTRIAEIGTVVFAQNGGNVRNAFLSVLRGPSLYDADGDAVFEVARVGLPSFPGWGSWMTAAGANGTDGRLDASSS